MKHNTMEHEAKNIKHLANLADRGTSRYKEVVVNVDQYKLKRPIKSRYLPAISGKLLTVTLC